MGSETIGQCVRTACRLYPRCQPGKLGYTTGTKDPEKAVCEWEELK